MKKSLLYVTLLGLALVACEGKKEEKKADEAAPPEAAAKHEEHKANPATPAEAPKEEKKAS